MHPSDPQTCNFTILERVQAQQKHIRVKHVTYNFDHCLVRWRYFRPVIMFKNQVFQNLHFDTPKIVSYMFDPPGGWGSSDHGANYAQSRSNDGKTLTMCYWFSLWDWTQTPTVLERRAHTHTQSPMGTQWTGLSQPTTHFWDSLILVGMPCLLWLWLVKAGTFYACAYNTSSDSLTAWTLNINWPLPRQTLCWNALH